MTDRSVRPWVCLVLLLVAAPAMAALSSEKIDPWILERLSGSAAAARVPVLVELAERADLSGAAALTGKLAKGQFVYERLRETAERTQGPLRERLRAAGVAHRAFVVANVVAFEADAALLSELAERDDVARIVGDSPIRVPDSDLADDGAAPGFSPDAIEWNILQVNADDVWALGYTGQGIVVAGQDTGYQWDHPALVGKYRGWNGATADHNYDWHDSIHGNDPHTGAGNPCGFDIVVPCDDNDHGTHTMGTMVGDDGGANQIGMAPGAKWISCRNMEEGWGMPSTYIECFNWFLAPTDLANQNPNPAMAPHVINNSWGCPTDEGCNPGNFAVMQGVIENLRAAGILTVVSAGNSGSGCSSVSTPAAIFDAVFTIGSTTSTDSLSSFSSRGPVTVDGSNRRKPDLSAPGSGIRSSVPGSTYAGGWSGTSMAAPHVAGAVALLLSARPDLEGDVDGIEKALFRTALPRTSAQGCGGDSATVVPNNGFGWGRLDILKAVQVLHADDAELRTLVRWDLVCPGGPGCV